MLIALRRLNAQLVGDRTVEVQAYLSLTGEHEERFLAWCQRYFAIRGSLERLNPSHGSEPWRLCVECYEEYNKLLERRIMQTGTVNSSVLNLSQRFMQSSFAAQVLLTDLTSYAKSVEIASAIKPPERQTHSVIYGPAADPENAVNT